MRKLLVVIGFVILFSGIIVASSSNLSYQKSRIEWTDVATSEENSWNFSRTFNDGELIGVEVFPGVGWENNLLAPDAAVPFPYRPVWVNITNPFGETSEFFCDFARPSGQPAVFLYNVTITESNGLLVGANASLKEEMRARARVMGITMLAGEHTAIVVGTPSPPSAIIWQIGERIAWTEYPYTNLLYVGIAIIITGAFSLFFGFRKAKKKPRAKRVKRSRKGAIR